MPPRKCTHLTSSGAPCRAWAIKSSDPALCSAHAGRTKGKGAPRHNLNRRTHGFYSSSLDPDELADLVRCADDLTLDDEIALARVTLRRLMNHLNTRKSDLNSDEITKLSGMIMGSTRTIARLLRDQRALSGDAADGIAGAIGQALDELTTQFGIQL